MHPLLFAPLFLAALQSPSPGSFPPPATPTTKVLAIGHLTQAFTPDKARAIMRQEVSDTVRLYLGGKLEQWFSRNDQRGVVFVLNVTSTKEAGDLLEQLPLGREHLMQFDLIPLGPLAPLQVLLRDAPPTP